MPSLIKSILYASELCLPLKHRNHKGIPLFTNTQREKKNSKSIHNKHMVKGNMDFIVRMFNTKFGNNMRDKQGIEIVRRRGKGAKETPKSTLNRFKLNK